MRPAAARCTWKAYTCGRRLTTHQLGVQKPFSGPPFARSAITRAPCQLSSAPLVAWLQPLLVLGRTLGCRHAQQHRSHAVTRPRDGRQGCRIPHGTMCCGCCALATWRTRGEDDDVRERALFDVSRNNSSRNGFQASVRGATTPLDPFGAVLCVWVAGMGLASWNLPRVTHPTPTCNRITACLGVTLCPVHPNLSSHLSLACLCA